MSTAEPLAHGGHDRSTDRPSDPISKAIGELLTRHGVSKSEFAAVIAEILELTPQSARRRLSGDPHKGIEWSIDEISRIAKRYGEDPVGIVAAAFLGRAPLPGSIEINNAMVPCRFWPDESVPADDLVGPMVALEPEIITAPWRIVPIEQLGDRRAAAIHSFVVDYARRRLRVAILDDDATLAESLIAVLRLRGIDAVAFTDAARFLEAQSKGAFDGYVIDWQLGPSTSRDLLPVIRRGNPRAPVIVLTGRIETGDVPERDVHAAVQAIQGELMEKPAKMSTVLHYLQRPFVATA